MRLCAKWARLHAEIDAQMATPDGRRALESMFPDLRHKWAHPQETAGCDTPARHKRVECRIP